MVLYDELFTFVKVVESKSYTLAAQLLGISQPSIRRHIQNLESSLGKDLVYSAVNSIEITEFGNQVYACFKDKGVELENLLSSLLEDNQEIKGTLRVTLPINLAAKLITPYLPEFLQKHPAIKLKLNLKSNAPNLFSTGFDIAVSLVLPTQPSLIVRTLFSTNISLYCTKEYAKKYGIPQSFADIDQRHTISYLDLVDSKNTYPVKFTNNYTGKDILVENNCSIALNNTTNGIILMQTGEFIMGLEDYDFFLNANEDLIKVLPEYTLLDNKYYLILPSKFKNSKVQAFCLFLEECIQRYKDSLITLA